MVFPTIDELRDGGSFPTVASNSDEWAERRLPAGGHRKRVGRILVVAGPIAAVLLCCSLLWLRTVGLDTGMAAALPESSRRSSVGAAARRSEELHRATKLDEVALSPRRLRLLVPLYVYPIGAGRVEWHRLIDAARRVDVTAIVNPASGPGEKRDPDYALILAEARTAGVKLLGYVTTDYGKRPIDQVVAEMRGWAELYPQIHGFFLDQQSPDAAIAPYYVELGKLAQRIRGDAFLINNPGCLCDAEYLERGTSEVTCVFADFKGFDSFKLPPNFDRYDAGRFAAMPYNVASADVMRTLVNRALMTNIGYFYITDGQQPNQWDRLPTYWEEEVTAIASGP